MIEVPISPGDKSVPVVLLLTVLIVTFCVSDGIGAIVRGDWLERGEVPQDLAEVLEARIVRDRGE